MNITETDVFNNFKGASWFNPDMDVIIVGTGGVGSWLSLSLARQGYNLYLYEFDTIEGKNIGNQLFSYKDIGKTKAEVVKDLCTNYAENDSVELLGRYDEDSMTGNVVISCVDSIPVRKIIFEKWVAHQLNKTERPKDEINIFIDARMGMEIGQVFAVTNKKQVEEYRKTLWDDSKSEPEICSLRATTQTGLIISGLMTSTLLNHITNKKEGINMRDVPFLTSFELPMLNFDKTYV